MLQILENREIFSNHKNTEISSYFNENILLDSLHITNTLKGHSSCVNTLCWNQSGSLLASGSDDRSIIIWMNSANNGVKKHTIETKHQGNVFAVQFLPAKHDEVVVSGAADKKIYMHHVEHGNDCSWDTDGRVKRIATLQDDPFLFWAASESIVLRQIDSRTNQVDNLITFPESETIKIKSMAMCEAKPNLIALALNKSEVPIYDRRNTSAPILRLHPWDHNAECMYATHVSFNKAGTECVVNQKGGNILVYDLDETKHPRIFEKLDTLLSSQQKERFCVMCLPHRELREIGAELLKQKKFTEARDFYSNLLEKYGEGKTMRSVLHANKGMALLTRRFRGDSYECLRECVLALQENGANSKALWRIIRACIVMEQWAIARKCIQEFRRRFPNDNSVEKLEQQLADSIETDDGIAGFANMMDYKERYCGHLNDYTDIKEANFFGSRDQYIVAGSDCGSMFMWDRKNGAIKGIWKADRKIVNILQPHPQLCMLATSGIDEEIRLWEPVFDVTEDFRNFDRIENPYEYMDEMHNKFSSMGMIMLQNLSTVQPGCITS